MDWHKHTHKHTLVNTQHLQKSSGNSELSSHERSSGGNRDWTNVRKKKPQKAKIPLFCFSLPLLPLPCCMLPLLASFLPHYSQLLLCLFFLSNLVFFIPEHPIFNLLFFLLDFKLLSLLSQTLSYCFSSGNNNNFLHDRDFVYLLLFTKFSHFSLHFSGE